MIYGHSEPPGPGWLWWLLGKLVRPPKPEPEPKPEEGPRQ